MREITRTDWQRFAARLNVGDCWLWTGARTGAGYGHFQLRKRDRLAHRFAYEYLVGQIPAGLVLDHRCRVRACVNPDHLEPVTLRVNTHRARARLRCRHGHALELRGRRGGRVRRWCRLCNNEQQARRRAVAA